MDTTISNLAQLTLDGTGFDDGNMERGAIPPREDYETTSPVPPDITGILGLPADDPEQERLKIQAAKCLELKDGKLFLAPINATPQRILHLGIGVGSWAIDVADMYPAATVVASDLARFQPMLIPLNCHFRIGDLRDLWLFPEKIFDFIYARDVAQSLGDWPEFVQRAYQSLTAGGWLELPDLWPPCDDSSLSPSLASEQTFHSLESASSNFGVSASPSYCYADCLRQKGFVNVVEKVYKTSWSPTETTGTNVGISQRPNVANGAKNDDGNSW